MVEKARGSLWQDHRRESFSMNRLETAFLSTGGAIVKPLFTHAELRQMNLSAKRGRWVGLVQLPDIPTFAVWLFRCGWICQSPDIGDLLAETGFSAYVSV